MQPYIEYKVKYLILVQVKTEIPTFDKKNKTIVSFQTMFYKSVYGKLFNNKQNLLQLLFFFYSDY